MIETELLLAMTLPTDTPCVVADASGIEIDPEEDDVSDMTVLRIVCCVLDMDEDSVVLGMALLVTDVFACTEDVDERIDSTSVDEPACCKEEEVDDGEEEDNIRAAGVDEDARLWTVVAICEMVSMVAETSEIFTKVRALLAVLDEIENVRVVGALVVANSEVDERT